MHELRQSLGFRRLPAACSEEQAMRDAWYARRKEWEDAGFPDSGNLCHAFFHIDRKLSSFLWDRAQALIAIDKAKHPKAKRNLPVPPKDPEALETRCLP